MATAEFVYPKPGAYRGFQTGYEICVMDKEVESKVIFVVTSEEGVRGLMVPCIVNVSADTPPIFTVE